VGYLFKGLNILKYRGITMDLGLKDKAMFVAASSKGIGFGVAKALAEEGADVLIGSRDKGHFDKSVEELDKLGKGRIVGHFLDASDARSIKEWIEFGTAKLGDPDGLLVNAGGPPAGKFLDFYDSDWQNAFELTLMSAERMIKAVLPKMRKKGKGSVLAVTSSSVKEPIESLLLSNVMRSGVTSLMKSLSFEFGPENIRFNNLVPGRIDTKRVKHLDETNSKMLNIPLEEHKKNEMSTIPLRRYGTTDEIGRAGAFLLSDAASYISGVTLLVDGAKTKTVW